MYFYCFGDKSLAERRNSDTIAFMDFAKKGKDLCGCVEILGFTAVARSLRDESSWS